MSSTDPFQYNIGGGTSIAPGNPVKKVNVAVVHAGFGDAILLEVEHDNGEPAV